MDGNSPKPTQIVDTQVSALGVLRTWLEREGGNLRIPQVLDLLAERSASDLAAGHPCPTFDAGTLRQLYFDAQGGRIPDMVAARWLPSTQVRRWWDQREGRIEQACREAGLDRSPELVLQAGGGRSNPTQYRFSFRPIPEEEMPAGASLEGAVEDRADVIRYVVEPAKPAWWLRPVIGSEPFRMRSWRGYTLLGLVIAELLLLAVLWLAVFISTKAPRPIVSTDLFRVALAAVVTVSWWWALRPIIQLPRDRVTIALDPYLAWTQFYGQFRLTRDSKSKVAGGWFRLVRHWAYCPICSGEVEVHPGGNSFPGRLVGRCSDSPLEHVFSFDPVSLSGSSLRN